MLSKAAEAEARPAQVGAGEGEESGERVSNRRHQRGGWADHDKLERGPNGRALCRRCATEVPKGRQTFCSAACVTEWQIRTNAAFARQQVWKRDKGVCADCGSVARERYWERYPHEHGRRADEDPGGECGQADHIIPVVEGGGECGLDNLRTLCTECHRKATAALRQRMRERRIKAKALPLLEQEDA